MSIGESERETSAQSAWPWHIQLTNKTVSLSKSWGGKRPGLYQNGWGGNGKQRQQNQLNPLAGSRESFIQEGDDDELHNLDIK